MSETFEDMAVKLRAEGWVCIPPSGSKLDTAEPEVGQTWGSSEPRIQPRTITKVGQKYGNSFVRYVNPNGIPNSLSLESWQAWVRKTKARHIKQGVLE